MKTNHGAALAVLAALLIPAAARAHPAVQVIDWIWKYTGGRENFEKARFLEFTWAAEANGKIKAERHHTWDRFTGDYVLRMKDSKTGDPIQVYFNVNSKDGVAIRNGEVLEADDKKAMLERAYAIFINDTYWLLCPTKLDDYGVRVQSIGHSDDGVNIEPFAEAKPIRLDDPEGARERQQEEYLHHEHGDHPDPSHGPLVCLHVFFSNVGLTPGDQYWLFVKHDGQVAKWRYELEGGQKGEYDWSDYRDCGMGVMLATRKTATDGSRAIVFPDVRFSDSLDPSVFQYGGSR